jgi:RNA polymerase sigma-70 factor (ECF subfamily)
MPEPAVIARDDPAAAFDPHRSYLRGLANRMQSTMAEAEDAVQDAYLQAYRKMHEFRGDSKIDTWLTRITVNAALMRLRKQRHGVIVPLPSSRGRQDNGLNDVPDSRAESPQDAAVRSEIRRALERRIDELPLAFRTVFVMRDVQDMTSHETAAALGIPEATVRTRLFRARTLLREALQREIDDASADVFAFAGERCDRIVAAVLRAIETGA